MARPEWVELETDVLDCVDMLLSKLIPERVCVRPHLGKDMMRAVQKKSLDRAKRLLGLSLLPAGKQGERNWHLAADWEQRLKVAGVDPRILGIVDQQKWTIRLMRFDHEEREKKERKEKQLTRTELKGIRESARNGWTPSGSGRSLGDQLKEPDEEEIDPSSIGGRLRSQRSDRISMRDY
jgi:hypothetical protein